MNKSSVTNLVALITALAGYFSPIYSEIIFSVGIFALSGAITNWIAVHMIFERVPFIYGSGVIPNRFEEFKIAIKQLIIEEFFNKAHIEQFFKDSQPLFSAKNIKEQIDFDKIFNDLLHAIVKSPTGAMLQMFGGKDSLTPLKEPVTKKLQDIIDDLVLKNSGKKEQSKNDDLIRNIEKIIDLRLGDLTPDMVKEIIQKMISDHLGWLVIWGGVFGGLIGFLFAVIS